MVNFLLKVARNFGMKFLREEVTDCGAVDGALLCDSCRTLSLYGATCDSMLAEKCLLTMENLEFRDLIDEIGLREFWEIESVVWRVL